MQLPVEVLDLRTRYVAHFPVPRGEPGAAFEAEARAWSIRFADQVAWSLPDQGWGMKRASTSRPISKDTIARWAPPGVLLVWDLLLGTGTGHPRLVMNPESQDVTGQVFVSVTPRDHLAPIPHLPLPPGPLPNPVSVCPCRDEIELLAIGLKVIATEQGASRAEVARLTRKIEALPQAWTGTRRLPWIGAVTLTLIPKAPGP